MKYFYLFTIFLLVVFIRGEENDSAVFVATNEWQTLKEGQSVPAGLHIRINLTTGKKEAKLISTDEQQAKQALSVVPNQDGEAEEARPKEETTKDKLNKLEAAMKGIPTEDITYSEAELKIIKSKFKSSETIKQEFKDMNMNIQTDSEIMDDLFVRLQNATSASEKLSVNESDAIFEDLEYLLHQVDNALDFVTKGGLEKLIIPNLANQTNTRLTILSLRLLAAITQNNPKGQIAAFERNVGDHLIRILSNSKSGDEITAGVSAFGSLIRRFPLAQKEVFRKSGLNALIRLLDEDSNLRIKLKTILLITDLMDESQEASHNKLNESETAQLARVQQYKEVELEKHLNSSNFCERIDEFFVLHRSDILDDIDVAEKTIQSLVIAEKCCYVVWSQSPLFRHTLLVIKNNFDNRLLDASPGDREAKEYLEHITKQLGYLNEALYKHIVIKDEL